METISIISRGIQGTKISFYVYADFAFHAQIILFADDTTICSPTKLNNDDLLNDLGRLCDWFDRNKLTVNFSKCNMTCFARRETANRLQLQGMT